MKNLLCLVLLLFCISTSSQEVFKKIDTTNYQDKIAEQPKDFEQFQLNTSQLLKKLLKTPLRESKNKASIILSLPNGLGGFEDFEIFESQILSIELSKKYPTIKSYVGRSTKSTSTVRFSYSPSQGFNASISNNKSATILIKPSNLKNEKYISFSRKDISEESNFECQTIEDIKNSVSDISRRTNDGYLRRYRLAVATTAEYSGFFLDGTEANDTERKTKVLAAINTSLTRINGIFERDFAITMELVSNNDLTIFLDPSTDPFNGSFNSELQNTLDNTIGDSNYDVGHLFAYEGSVRGNAGCIACVCTTGSKGSGYTIHNAPDSDYFNIIVSHELGHQFGGYHVQSSSNCRSSAGLQEVEPGSGSTIMGYAGICPPNVQNRPDDYFNYVDIRDIIQWTRNDSSCAELITTGNNDPTVNAGNNYTIPKSTAFILEGTASDIDSSNNLTYCWEENDPENPYSSDYPSSTRVLGPMYRSKLPISEPIRYMPQLSDVLSGNLTPTWEVTPSVSRTLDFVLTVRDNALLGAKTASDEMTVTIDDNFNPFRVTSQNTAENWNVGDTKTITWDTANTTNSPINATNVDIFLSVDGGYTYPYTIASNIANDGSESIVIPEISSSTTEGRFMVKASNNIFFAVNETNINIQSSEFILKFDDYTKTVCIPNIVKFNFTYKTFLGFSEVTNFSAGGIPTGVNVSFNPSSALADGTQVEVIVSNTTAFPLGINQFNVIGTSTNVTKQAVLNLSTYSNSIAEPQLSLPSNNQFNVDTNTTFSWNSNNNAENYSIEIATDNLFSSIIDSSTINDNNYISNNLEYNTHYFWRVKATNSCGTSLFSNTFNFTTFCKPPSNINITNITASSVDVSWTETGNASSWEIEIVNQGVTPTGSGTVVSVNSHTINNLNSSENYDIYLRSLCSASNSSSWVGPVSFSTLSDFCNGDRFYDSGGPNGNYSNNENITTVISLNGADIVQAAFLSFSIESGWDYLYIHDGSDTNAPLIGTYSGSNIPPVIRSSQGNDLTFYFSSDGSVTYSGWEVEISCITVTCPAPSNLASSNLSANSFNLSWTSNGSETNWEIEYGTVGFTNGNGTTVSATSNPFTLNGLTPVTNYDIYVRANCGTTPGTDDSLWVGPISIETPCGKFTAPYFYDVEQQTSGIVEDCWTSNPPTHTGNYYWLPRYSYQYDTQTGPYQAKSGNLFFASNTYASAGDVTELYTPFIDIASLNVPVLDFYTFMHGSNVGSLHVDILDNGSWTTDVLVINGEQQTDARDLWQEQLVPLSTFGDTIQVRFRAIAGGYNLNEIDIDDISVIEMPSCPNPTNFEVSNITASSVDLNWTSNGNETNWEIEYGTVGFTNGNGTTVNATTNPFILSNLNSQTNYDIYLRANCGTTPGTDDSLWVGPISAQTLGNYCNGDHFYDSGGANGNYQNNENKTTVIAPLFGDYVTVNFLEFNLEGCCDRLTIYDGPDVTAPSLGYFSGSNLPGTFTSTHTTGALTFHFSSDGSITRSGWNAEVTCVSISCPPPTNAIVSNITATQVTIDWLIGGTENSWEIEYGYGNFNQGNGTTIQTSNNSQILTNLAAGTGYSYYLRANCGTSPGDNDSQWIGPFNFTTSCGVVSAPLYENFSGFSRPNCWEEFGFEPWNFNTYADFEASTAGDHTPSRTTNYAWIDGSPPSGNSHMSRLRTPWLDISNLADPAMSFSLFSVNTLDNFHNTFKVVVYDFNGARVELLMVQQSTDGWKTYVLDFSNLAITDVIQIEFVVLENSPGFSEFNDILIDEIKVNERYLLNATSNTISDFKYYPNPVKKLLTIESSEQITLVLIYSILGQKIYSLKPESIFKFDVDVSNLPNGTYMVKALSDNKLHNFKIIIDAE